MSEAPKVEPLSAEELAEARTHARTYRAAWKHLGPGHRAAWLDQFAASIRDVWINHDIDAHVAYERGWQEVAQIASVGMTLSTGAQPLERARTILKTAVVNALEALKRLEEDGGSDGSR